MYGITVVLNLCNSGIQAQISPGGVGVVNLTAWFRADDIAPGNITSWTTYYPAGAITVTDPQAPYALLTNTPAGAVSNYNRTLEFAGNSYTGLNTTTLKGLGNSGSFSLLSNAYTGNTGSFFNAYYLPQPPANNGHMMMYNNSPTGIQMRNLGISGRLALGLLPSNSTYASRDWSEDNKPSIISYRGNRGSSTSMTGYYKGLILPTPATASQSSGSNGLYFGYSPTIGTSAYNGYLHEFIFFNVDLTANEFTRVHTYLAIKYGVTLNNSGGGSNGDYLATNSTLLWDASVNPGYHKDVIGIGRDDAEGLIQRQSHTFDDSCRIYLNTLAATNETNTGGFGSDISYILMGHNGARLCGTPTANTEAPAGITTRLTREYKVTKTNFNQAFGWDVKVDTCSSIETSVLANQVYLLVDDDGDFTNAQAYGVADGLMIIIQNGIVSIQGITSLMVSDNSTNYITIGYQDASYSIAGSGPVCQGNPGYVVFSVQNTSNPVDVTYSVGTTNYTVNSLADGDTLYLSDTSTTTYVFKQLKSLFNCCSSNATMTYQQVVNPNPIVGYNATDTILCAGDSVTLSGTGASSYTWNNAVTDGQAFAPATGSITYQVIGVDSNGCSDTNELTVSVYDLPQVTIQGEMTICRNTSMVLTAATSDSGTFQWAGTGSTYLSSLTDQTTAFTVGTIGSWSMIVELTDTIGCKAYDTVYFQSINCEIPIAQIQASQTTICRGESIDFLDVSIGDSISIQNWMFPGGVPGTATGTGPFSVLFANPGTYWVVLEEGNFVGSDFDSLLIEVLPCNLPEVSFVTDTNEVCENQCIQVTNTSVYGTTYEWYVNSNLNQTTQAENPEPFCFDQDGVYTITLIGTNQYGSDTVSDTWTVHPLPDLQVQNYFSMIYGDSVTVGTIHSPGILSWTPGQDLCATCDTNTISPPVSTDYTLFITTVFGCEVSQDVHIEVTYENFVDVPDNFSPNGDGQNDVLYVYGFGIKHMKFRIFNRYGQQVFISTDQSTGWDGTIMGESASTATFAYTLEYELIQGGKYFKEGYVNLMR